MILMQIRPEILHRKGPRKPQDIPEEVLHLLNQGQIETVNLAEWLGVDQLHLLAKILQERGKAAMHLEISQAVQSQKKITANNNARLIGQMLGPLFQDPSLEHAWSTHISDVVRAWACWARCRGRLSLQDLITQVYGFAGDGHFGVREVAVFATKEVFAQHLEESIMLLSPLTEDPEENIRRFVAEVLRPIGVWTKKIPALQENPSLGLPLLEPLKADPSRYVQNSVANWLNDASKSQGEWVRSLCERWKEESSHKATQYIIKRALRTLNK